jgi:hypothetical protein
LALAVPLSRFTSRVGGGSAFYVRQLEPRLRDYQIHTMKTTHRRLLVVGIGLALVAGLLLLPSFKATKRHATKIHAVNTMSSFSYSISTNELAKLQTQKH